MTERELIYNEWKYRAQAIRVGKQAEKALKDNELEKYEVYKRASLTLWAKANAMIDELSKKTKDNAYV